MRDLLARHATMILDGGPSICGNPMTLDVPAAAGFADRLRTVFFALVSLECTLTRGAVQRNGLDFDLHSRVLLLLAYPIQPAGLGPTVHTLAGYPCDGKQVTSNLPRRNIIPGFDVI
jgi:hypothetical protein